MSFSERCLRLAAPRLSVQLSHCLVFAVRCDRAFVRWGDRPTEWLRFTPSVQSSPFEMVEMERIVSGKRGWVTRGLREYVGKGDRATLPLH